MLVNGRLYTHTAHHAESSTTRHLRSLNSVRHRDEIDVSASVIDAADAAAVADDD